MLIEFLYEVTMTESECYVIDKENEEKNKWTGEIKLVKTNSSLVKCIYTIVIYIANKLTKLNWLNFNCNYNWYYDRWGEFWNHRFSHLIFYLALDLNFWQLYFAFWPSSSYTNLLDYANLIEFKFYSLPKSVE